MYASVWNACRFNATETLSTVRFGSRAKDIKNKPKVNVMRSMREMEQLLDNANKQITRQNKVIGALQTAVNKYRELLKSQGITDTVAPDDSFLEKLGGNATSTLSKPYLSCCFDGCDVIRGCRSVGR